jgi:thioester reductase-like protein
MNYPKNVFLTGATGVLGGRILKDLLQFTRAHIYCIARGNDAAHCQARVHSFLRVYTQNDSLDAAFLERVTVLQGDVTQDLIGLSAAAYVDLQRVTDLTIHAAANTSLLLKYKRLEPVNVHGTGRMIEFCLGTPKKNLAYVSTFTVMGDKTFDETVRFQESDYNLGQGFEYMNYQHSKFRAEAMVRSAGEFGLNWRIFRPGQIYGDSSNGAYPHSETQVTGLFYDLFRTAMDTQVMPESYIHFDVVPVDYVSRAITLLTAGDDNYFEVYHLINPDTKNFAEVMNILRDMGYPITLLPEEIYKERLLRGKVTMDGKPYSSSMLTAFKLWYFISKISFIGSAKTDCDYTYSKLQRLGVTCPPINRKLMQTYVDAGIREGYFPLPAKKNGANEVPANQDIAVDSLRSERLPL